MYAKFQIDIQWISMFSLCPNMKNSIFFTTLLVFTSVTMTTANFEASYGYPKLRWDQYLSIGSMWFDNNIVRIVV